MKKRIGIFLLLMGMFFFIIGSIYSYRNYQMKLRLRNAIINVSLVDDLNLEVYSEVSLSSLIKNINGTLCSDDLIDTKKLGIKTIEFFYINEENLKVPYSFQVNIVDTIAPLIWLNESYSVNIGSSINLLDKIMCGDNYDDNPQKEIIGEYNLDKIGTYPLLYKATDSSGNVSLKKFNLYVKKNNSKNSIKTISFQEIYQKYKNSKTKIGLDVSKWQGNIDYSLVKDAGVEFVFIKIGQTSFSTKEPYMDSKFKENIEGFLQFGIPVGLYYYSAANNEETAILEANWVLSQIKDYTISLPIAFDWENWGSYNKYEMSFYKLNQTATAFIETINNAGYQGILYSSKNYLEKIWTIKNPVWLAHYTTKTNYTGSYRYWQMTSSCKINGINDNTVDVNIMYID